MEASVAAKTNKTDLPSVFKTVAGTPGAMVNPFAFTTATIANVISRIPSIKTHPDQQYTKRPIPNPDQETNAANNIYAYEKPINISVPGQQAQVPEVSVEPGIKTAPTKDLLGQLKLAYQLVTDPALKKLFKNAIIEQQGLA